MMSVTTNTAALTAQRYLHGSGQTASSSIAKMSSGSWIVKPSDDAASLAISNKLSANIGALEQAARNAAQGASLLQVASGALDRISEMLTRMKILSSQVNNGALSSTERLFAQQEFSNRREQITNTATQTCWSGLSHLTGGGGDVTVTSAGGAIAQGATGLTAVADAFAGTLGANTQGFVTGIATEAKVTANGDLYNVTVTIGEQTFKAPTAGGTLDLVSTTDSRDVVSLNYAAAVRGGHQRRDLPERAPRDPRHQQRDQGDLHLGVDRSQHRGERSRQRRPHRRRRHRGGHLRAPVHRQLQHVHVDPRRSGSGPRRFSEDGAQTVSFDNGATVAQAADFDATTDIGQLPFNVAAGDSVSMSFQVAEGATDAITINFVAATASALNLTGLSLATIEDAATAGAVLDAAINTVNIAQANLGAVMSRFE